MNEFEVETVQIKTALKKGGQFTGKHLIRTVTKALADEMLSKPKGERGQGWEDTDYYSEAPVEPPVDLDEIKRIAREEAKAEFEAEQKAREEAKAEELSETKNTKSKNTK